MASNNAFATRLKNAWNVFLEREKVDVAMRQEIGRASYYNPLRIRSIGSERSLVTAVYNRIAMDVAAFDIQHVRVDENKRYIATIESSLNNCLMVEANKDQTGRAFIQDVVMSMFDEGVVAIVPVDADFSPLQKNSYEIYSLRTGKVIEWYPEHVRIEVYNDTLGAKEKITLPKKIVGIIENPLYAVMNEPNSTMKRLISKLNLLDYTDENNSSSKLDLIIQLPYVIKSEARKKQAEERRASIEDQLTGSKYGIAYTDGTERITQLNRPVENTLLAQITYLTTMLYSQLGISEEVFTGKANPASMLNYYNRTVEPIVISIVDEIKRKFLTKTARTQGQTMMGFHDVFRLVPANELAEIADTLTRNEIVSSNEIRSILGMRPSNAPQADELRNKQMPPPNGDSSTSAMGSPDTADYDALIEETIAGIEADMLRILEEQDATITE